MFDWDGWWLLVHASLRSNTGMSSSLEGGLSLYQVANGQCGQPAEHDTYHAYIPTQVDHVEKGCPMFHHPE